MGALSSKLRSVEGNRVMFWCPGCDCAHSVRVGEGTGPFWTWNGDAERPTFSPSILVRGTDFTPAGRHAYQKWLDGGCKATVTGFEKMDTCCHSFVTDGRIQFLGDCTHALAGQTVEIPDF